MRSLGIVALAVAVSGCAIQRAQVAQDARVQMVGMSKEQILACMGPPASKAAEGLGLQLRRWNGRRQRINFRRKLLWGIL